MVNVAVATEPSAMKLLAKDREELGFVSDMAIAFLAGTHEPCPLPSQDSIWRLEVIAVTLETLPTTTTSATLFPVEAEYTHSLAHSARFLEARFGAHHALALHGRRWKALVDVLSGTVWQPEIGSVKTRSFVSRIEVLKSAKLDKKTGYVGSRLYCIDGDTTP